MSATARSEGVPRSTLRYWLERESRINAEAEVVAFFESEAGLKVLHRIVLALHVIVVLKGCGGIRKVGECLELAGLGPFVATSYSAQRRINIAVEKEIGVFAKAETERLGAKMEKKRITLCGDETFLRSAKNKPCLVAIEPVSNFIVLEEYADRRDADTWKARLDDAMRPINAEVFQFTSDQAKGLLSMCKKSGWHQSPDLMHIKQPLAKCGYRSLDASIKKQCEEVQKAKQQADIRLRRYEKEQSEYTLGALMAHEEAIKRAEAEEERQIAMKEEVKAWQDEVTRVYHPFDLDTALPRTAEELQDELDITLEALETAAQNAGLSKMASRGVPKVKGMVQLMVTTLAFFWAQLNSRLTALDLPIHLEQLFTHTLVPRQYLRIAAQKAANAKQKASLLELAKSLDARLDLTTAFNALDDDTKNTLENTARECAQLFQRSSSCVEGRNGLLSLNHHATHRITQRRMTALTTIHNFHTTRTDHTTPAERFFGAKHRDLFAHLLATIKPPPRPAKKRHKKKSSMPEGPMIP